MTNPDRAIFSGMKILHQGIWLTQHAVIVEANQIQAIIPDDMIIHHLPAKRYHYSAHHFLMPGLIDLHIHGANGHDVMDATPDALQTISQTLAQEGITGFLATTMTASPTAIAASLAMIARLQSQEKGAKILGVHLEGPFISPEKLGAQAGENCQPLSLGLFEQWQMVANGAIKVVTLAPELAGATAFIQALRDKGIIVSIGHTNATYEETQNAIQQGCSQATHLFNAMRGLQQREPGATGALLLSPQIKAELIVDGVHLHPAVIELAYRLKGAHHLLLVTDAMRAKCLGEGNYDLGGQMVLVKNGKATLRDGTLAGSLLQLPQAIQKMTQYSGCSLIEAIQMATFNPAEALGLSDRRGSIEVGKIADLVVMNADWQVELTMGEGRVLYQSSY